MQANFGYSNLLVERLYIKDDQQLAYDKLNGKFNVISIDDAPGITETTDVRELAQRIDVIMQNNSFGHLTAPQLASFIINAEVLNGVYDHYNLTIDESCFWSFINFIVQIVTCGLSSLKFDLIEKNNILDVFEKVLLDNGVNKPLDEDLDEVVKIFEQMPLDILKDICSEKPAAGIMISKRALDSDKFGLAREFLYQALNQFHILPDNVRVRFLEMTDELIGKDGGFLWEADTEPFSAFMSWIAADDARKMGASANSLYLDRLEIYNPKSLEELLELTEGEREQFDAFLELVLWNDAGLTHEGRSIHMALLGYLAKKNSKTPYKRDTAEFLLKRVSENYEDLKPGEIDLVLELANALKFDVTKKNGKDVLQNVLGATLIQKLTNYVVKAATPPDEWTPLGECTIVFNNSLVALQLCFLAALKDRIVDIEDELGPEPDVLRELDICNVMEQLNISALDNKEHSHLFEMLIGNENSNYKELFRFVNLFEKNPDRYLGSANEIQLETYYKNRELDIDINRAHIKVINKVPTLPDDVDVSVDELATMFAAINFDNPANDATYCPPSMLKDDEAPTTSQALKMNLDNLIFNINNRSDYLGVPKSDQEKTEYYDKLELYIKHIILMLRDLPEGERVYFLITLAVAGNHCGGRWKGEAMSAYKKLSQIIAMEIVPEDEPAGSKKEENNGGEEKGEKDLESLTSLITRFIDDKLSERREAIFENVVRKKYQFGGGTTNTHAIPAALHRFGNDVGLDGGFEDPYDPTSEFDRHAIISAFFKEYNATAIINEMVKHLNGLAGHKKTVDRNTKDWIMDYLGMRLPPGCEGPGDYFVGNARFKRMAIIHLLKQLGYLEVMPATPRKRRGNTSRKATPTPKKSPDYSHLLPLLRASGLTPIHR